MAAVRAVCTLAALTLVSLLLIPAQWVAVKLGWSIQRKIPLLWHKTASRLIGLRVHQTGKMAGERPLLVAANHCSWLDIVALGSTQPLSFIAKSEVAGWPVFGMFAKLQRTVFVNRQRRTDTGRVAQEVAARMAQGDAMVLFAEGTSSNGNEVLPFRSALIGAVHQAMNVGEKDVAYVQPLSVAYVRLHGMPLGRSWRSHVAWYGDMELAGHLWAIIKEGGLDVELTWGAPIQIEKASDRKRLTRELEEQVRGMTIAALQGNAPIENVQSQT
ncbi:2-acyl-glycerophospho-ethanolamine acyltransferase [Pseudovibrio axinellae]|uniref:2-acyl-glycerophospho-ethanolamine acyltransferase n=1 Tax=Pseudovibrio axinellae TaxID=989403 RepID=A0A165Z7Z2_9HYPH|nr:lysophospholipid acyltransferase family protein [Pseudovibrio axinellae]KZL19588.1 2-acyl-glycerophospho-ethanolamine acyltransferase [Pseudovibrio axinellae]SEQ33206.1 1-acyl-sn-glycerol-3-phosphate acyltransferase [Pseudovibrio axinellae]